MATFTNQATLSFSGGTVNSNIATGNIIETLSLTKTPVLATYEPNDNVTYVINLINSGGAALTNLTLSDNLGLYQTTAGTNVYPLTYTAGSIKYYINGVLQTAPTVTAGPPLTITGITIPANSNAAIVYSADVNEFAPLAAASAISNEVTVTGAGITTPVTADASVTAASAPTLNIIKTVDPVNVTQNSRVTYTFRIQNTGNTPVIATDNAVIRDVFNPILSDIAVTFNSAAWTATTNYTYNTATGLFETVAGQITVPAATYTQDPATGIVTVTPGESVLTVTGTI
mgnify:CR=1 FL=1